MKPLNLDNRNSPSPSFRWGVAWDHDGVWTAPIWFRTKRAAVNYGDNCIGNVSYAVCVYSR